MTDGRVVMYLAGSNFAGAQGTDRQLAAAMSRKAVVQWVDPPVAIQRLIKGTRTPSTPRLNLRPHATWGPPFVTRPLIRAMSDHLYQRQVAGIACHLNIRAIILSSPVCTFPALADDGSRILFATDDWIAGAALMGLGKRYVRRVLATNLSRCSLLIAVSDPLVAKLRREFSYSGRAITLPNACNPQAYLARQVRPKSAPASPYAILLGQLNERLDLALVKALVDEKIDVVVAGSYRGRTRRFARAWRSLQGSPNFHYVGLLNETELSSYAQHASVGLCPYILDDFNRSSSPLKTWDYLAAGIPVLGTDLPALRQIPRGVCIAKEVSGFVALARTSLAGSSASDQTELQRLALENTWDRSADTLLREMQ